MCKEDPVGTKPLEIKSSAGRTGLLRVPLKGPLPVHPTYRWDSHWQPDMVYQAPVFPLLTWVTPLVVADYCHSRLSRGIWD